MLLLDVLVWVQLAADAQALYVRCCLLDRVEDVLGVEVFCFKVVSNAKTGSAE